MYECLWIIQKVQWNCFQVWLWFILNRSCILAPFVCFLKLNNAVSKVSYFLCRVVLRADRRSFHRVYGEPLTCWALLMNPNPLSLSLRKNTYVQTSSWTQHHPFGLLLLTLCARSQPFGHWTASRYGNLGETKIQQSEFFVFCCSGNTGRQQG